MFVIILLQYIAAFLQQELAQYIEPEQSIEPYLAYLDLQHEIESNYYQACGGW